MHISKEAGNKVTAETRFREAFERLKLGSPEIMPKGTPVSQNNVAKEAGRDPTALKKSRFPSLIAEIKQYVTTHSSHSESKYKKKEKQRAKARRIREQLADVTRQRDKAQSCLADANMLIVDLSAQVADLTRRLDELQPKAKQYPLKPRR